MNARRPRVVIVGAGFAGLACARALRRVPVDVTLVERTNYHLFQPLLYQVASGLLDPSQIAAPVRSVLRRTHNCDVLMAEVTSVDLQERRVHTAARDLDYDFLVVAAGSATDYFGDASLRARAIGLKDLDDALALRSRLLRNFERAAVCTDAAQRKRLLTFVVVGGGPTGVEFAGAVAELINHVLPKDYREVDFAEVRVMLCEAGDRLLPTFAPRLSRSAQRNLERKKVDVRLGTALREVTTDGVVMPDGESVPADMVVWTAGVRAVPLLGEGAPQVRHGRVEVTPSLHLASHPEVFVLGDMAALDVEGQPLPMLAPVAIQGGEHTARVIAARLRGREDAPFRYRDKGTMATVGRGAAVAQIGPLHINGLIGWLIWLFIHLLYLVGFRSRLIALWTWGWNYFFYDRPVRLITLPPPGG
ncbi:MAG: NAD(P)/FAD-dependent oxidoreductase [Candidatus Dormibacteraeota bacterium]|nr:NAD(P)/FAD-dependent oxidoreductase [Candidatus Dormibacteraeota bacterium]MBV9526007.1 NAD(P)/FAD-dependent oxidoreductase [Candidatus Dormibacteraeota bacterium]